MPAEDEADGSLWKFFPRAQPLSQPVVKRKRRPLKLTQQAASHQRSASQQRLDQSAAEPVAAIAVPARYTKKGGMSQSAAQDAEMSTTRCRAPRRENNRRALSVSQPAARSDGLEILRKRGTSPSKRKPTRRRVDEATSTPLPLSQESCCSDTPCSQDSERSRPMVFWDDRTAEAKKNGDTTAREHLVSSEPTHHQDALIQFWLNDAANPRAVSHPAALPCDIEDLMSPGDKSAQQKQKAKLLNQLAALKQRQQDRATVSTLEESQSTPQLPPHGYALSAQAVTQRLQPKSQQSQQAKPPQQVSALPQPPPPPPPPPPSQQLPPPQPQNLEAAHVAPPQSNSSESTNARILAEAGLGDLDELMAGDFFSDDDDATKYTSSVQPQQPQQQQQQWHPKHPEQPEQPPELKLELETNKKRQSQLPLQRLPPPQNPEAAHVAPPQSNSSENTNARILAEAGLGDLDELMAGDFFSDDDDATKYTSLDQSSVNTRAAIQGQPAVALEVHCTRCVVLGVESSECGAKTLNVLDATCGVESQCILRGSWASTPVEIGDVANIVGGVESPAEVYTIDEKTGYFILHPDTLITGTRVSESFKCTRMSILSQRLSSSETSAAAVNGSMLHDLFEHIVMDSMTSDHDFRACIDMILKRNMEGLYVTNQHEDVARKFLNEHIQPIQSWSRKYLSGTVSARLTNSPDDVCIPRVLQAEENIWSPTYGMKGKIDLAVCRQSSQGDAVDAPAALELKTGKPYPLTHNAQVMVYNLLMSDRYGVPVDKGLLFYLKNEEMSEVNSNRNCIAPIVMARNVLATHIRNVMGDDRCRTLPPMVQDERTCRNCFQRDSCFMHHSAVEGGTAEGSGVPLLFTETVGHLNDCHRDYFKLWMSMIDDEGTTAQTNQHELWTKTSASREKQGTCVGSLRVDTVEPTIDNQKTMYTFRRYDDVAAAFVALPPTNLSHGDFVVVSAEAPRHKLAVATGIVQSVDATTISVSLSPKLNPLQDFSGLAPRHPPVSSQVVATLAAENGDAARWRVDKDELSTGISFERGNLVRLFKADENMQRLRRMVVDLENPSFDSVTDSAADGQLGELNTDQRGAIQHVLCSQNYALILGMPGTGKTTTIARLVLSLVGRGQSVLLASFTNTAVDNILLKVRELGQDFIRLGRAASVHPDIRHHTADGAQTPHTVSSLRRWLDAAAVVATTCLGAKHSLFHKRRFDVCIVDEASQISQTMCLGPLCCANRFVLVGDHYQLPPLVRTKEAQEKGMAVSLFKRLSDAHPQAVHQLCSQYRMNEHIMALSNELVYGGQLKCGSPNVASARLAVTGLAEWPEGWLRAVLEPLRPVVFLDTDDLPDAGDSRAGDALQNIVEAQLVGQLVAALAALRVTDQSIGIISPYRSQLKPIENELKQQCDAGQFASFDPKRVEVHTVDKYQGRDKDCIILSLVRSNPERRVGNLLVDVRRINVAITRAKTKMIFVGSVKTLKSSPAFDTLLRRLNSAGVIWRLKPGDCDIGLPAGAKSS